MARVENGFWKVGGALLEEEWDTGSPKITGSALIAEAESKEEVLAALKEDVYSTSGVWDWDKVTIHPVESCIFRGLMKFS